MQIKRIYDKIYTKIGGVIYYKYPQYRDKMPDKMYLEQLFAEKMGYYMDFNNPRTFNEKLQWLKLYDRKPIYTSMVDKCEAKKYVERIIGSEYIIPTLAVYNDIDDIDLENLPNQFVIKTTHDSGGIVICKDKNKFDFNNIKQKLGWRFNWNVYYKYKEWPYKNVRPRIIVEAYKEDSNTGELRDYKFFCFYGQCKMMFIASGRQNEKDETRFDFFDNKFNHLPFKNGHPLADVIPSKPSSFDKMVELAEKLSKGIPHVRVDFYQANEHVYFGEMTFFHWSGLVPFEPKEWDYKLGELIKI